MDSVSVMCVCVCVRAHNKLYLKIHILTEGFLGFPTACSTMLKTVPSKMLQHLPSVSFTINQRPKNVEPFYYQPMHIMLKSTELLKHSKITLQHVSVYIETIFRELKSVLG